MFALLFIRLNTTLSLSSSSPGHITPPVPISVGPINRSDGIASSTTSLSIFNARNFLTMPYRVEHTGCLEVDFMDQIRRQMNWISVLRPQVIPTTNEHYTFYNFRFNNSVFHVSRKTQRAIRLDYQFGAVQPQHLARLDAMACDGCFHASAGTERATLVSNINFYDAHKRC